MAKTSYGKLAATFHHRVKGSVRLSLPPEFMDAMGKFDFLVHRKKGLEPSQIPAPARQEILKWTYEQPDDAVFLRRASCAWRLMPPTLQSTGSPTESHPRWPIIQTF